jgi:hypothetical protein
MALSWWRMSALIDRLRIELASTENVEEINSIALKARKIPGSEAEALAERAVAKAARCTPTAPRRPCVIVRAVAT